MLIKAVIIMSHSFALALDLEKLSWTRRLRECHIENQLPLEMQCQHATYQPGSRHSNGAERGGQILIILVGAGIKVGVAKPTIKQFVVIKPPTAIIAQVKRRH